MVNKAKLKTIISKKAKGNNNLMNHLLNYGKIIKLR